MRHNFGVAFTYIPPNMLLHRGMTHDILRYLQCHYTVKLFLVATVYSLRTPSNQPLILPWRLYRNRSIF